MSRAAVLFLGHHTRFSAIVLRRMLRSGIDVRGIVVPAIGAGGAIAPFAPPRGEIPVAREESVVGLAATHRVPVDGVEGFSGPVPVARISALAPDIIIAACFPFILPPPLLGRPRLGCLNLHPSVLPAFRGPSPVFWQLRAGVAETGVSLHYMTARVDAGDLLSQRRVSLAGGETASGIMLRLAEAGAEMVIDALGDPDRMAVSRRRQEEAGASYMGAPGPADFEVPTTWSADRAYRFMTGVAEWRVPFLIATGGGRIVAERALGIAEVTSIPGAHRTAGDETLIQFSPGVLRVRAARAPTPPRRLGPVGPP